VDVLEENGYYHTAEDLWSIYNELTWLNINTGSSCGSRQSTEMWKWRTSFGTFPTPKEWTIKETSSS